MNIVHLHTHSDYSLLDGLAKIKLLVKKAKDLGMPALALTDHGVMYGTIKFYKACKEAGIKPIIGCEVYIAPRKRTDKDGKQDSKPFHCTLLAKNMTGYKNLIKIVSDAHLTGFYYKPRTDKDFMRQHAEGIICLSGCPAAEIPRAVQEEDYDKARGIVKEYLDIFGEENFFFEIQPHKLEITQKTNAGIIKLAKEFNRPLVATNDIHYLNKEDTKAHEVLLAVNTGKDLDDAERMSLEDASLFMMTAQEMLEALPEYPEAIENTLKVAELVDLKLEYGDYILPKFPLPPGETDTSFLKKTAVKGFVERFGYEPDLTSTKDVQNDYSSRLRYELEIIEKMGFASYFLIVSEVVTWAKNQGVFVGPGRGSAAGSLVSYCTNITNLDPLKYGLLFERFLNPDRIAMPDIDLDFADDRRGEVIEHIRTTYGNDHVAQIVTFGVMKARMVVRDVARALGHPYEIGDRIAKLIPMGLNLEDAIKAVPELKQLSEEDPVIKHVIEMSGKLEGVSRHASIHAAGVVISKEPLNEYLPLQRSTKTIVNSAGETVEMVSTQFDMVDVEDIGLLKIDCLGLANLSIMKNAVRIIKKTENVDIDIMNPPLEDKKTFELLSRGDTVGVFQLESDGMRHYIKDLKPNQFEDIVAMVSLYRPGPMQWIPDFIERKHGRQAVTYLHPKMENALKETYGIVVYQEQVMQIAKDLCGFTGGQADTLRKGVAKKKADVLAKLKEDFINGAIEHSGAKREPMEKFWAQLEDFAQYCFNKSHAASYAMIAIQTAYLKANYPHEFMSALLTSEQNDLDKVAVAINESERMGIKVLPPDINESFEEFGVAVKENEGQKRKIIRFGLAAIKNVGGKAANMIVEDRKANGPYSSLEDLIIRTGSQVMNKKVVESLAKSGALESLTSRNQVLAGIDEIIKFSQLVKKEKNAAQGDLFGDTIKIDVGKLILPKVPEASKKQRLAWEKELLGLYISDHPLKEYADKLKSSATPIATITDEMLDRGVRIAGVIVTARKIVTKSNQSMAFVQMEDLTGNLEVVVFPGVLEKDSAIWESKSPIIVDGRVTTKEGNIKILASKAYDIDGQIPEFDANSMARQNGGRSNGNGNGNNYNFKKREVAMDVNLPKSKKSYLMITIPEGSKKDILVKIKEILIAHPGEVPVELMVPNHGGYHQIHTKTQITPSDELREMLSKLVGSNKVALK